MRDCGGDLNLYQLFLKLCDDTKKVSLKLIAYIWITEPKLDKVYKGPSDWWNEGVDWPMTIR